MLRLALAVLAGYVIFVVITLALFLGTGRDSHAAQSTAFMATSVVVGIVAAFAGGYLASQINTKPDITASRVLAFVIAIGATVSMISSRGSNWSQWAAILLLAPAALAGGIVWLRRRA
jgi:uncharacterized membrane protein YeaQ/YmgE (transglycosylase-associated protein family)